MVLNGDTQKTFELHLKIRGETKAYTCQITYLNRNSKDYKQK